MTRSSLRTSVGILALLLPFASTSICAPGTSFQKQYKGTPFKGARYQAGAQKIPGKVFCAYYDLGGEGVAYHDSDAVNNGSGKLNPRDGSYLNEFRMSEGVDTSYTKFSRDPQIDDTQY